MVPKEKIDTYHAFSSQLKEIRMQSIDNREIQFISETAAEIIDELLETVEEVNELRNPLPARKSDWAQVIGRCPRCNAPVLFEQKFCNQCGQAILVTKKR